MPDDAFGIYAPGILDLEITRGEPFYLSITCKDGLGVVVPLTGFTPVVEMRPEIESPNLYDLEPAVQSPATDGVIIIDLDSDDTFTKFVAGRFQWAALLKHTSTGKREESFLKGTCLVLDRPNRI